MSSSRYSNPRSSRNLSREEAAMELTTLRSQLDENFKPIFEKHGPQGIELGQLRRELEDEGLLEYMTRARMEELLRRADADADQLITYREFVNMAGISVPLMPLVLRLACRTLCTMAENYTPSASMAFVTVPNIDVAKKLAHGLVKEKLVACVNIIPGITSVYEWQNEIEEDKELLLMMKTVTSKVDNVSEYVRKNHPYDVAEVISSKIDNGNPPYLKWIADVTMAGKEK